MKNVLKGITSVVLIACILLVGVGCGDTSDENTLETSPTTSAALEGGKFPERTVRTKEEIEKTGITPNDVLAIANKFLFDELYLDIDIYNLAVNQSTLSVEFKEMVPYDPSPSFTLPFYLCKLPGWMNHTHIYVFDGEGYINADPVNVSSNLYLVNLTFDFTSDGEVYLYQTMYIAIPEDTFIDLMNSFGIQGYTLTEERANEHIKKCAETCSASIPTEDKESFVAGYIEKYVDRFVYEPTFITKEMIENANEEQLKALYTTMEEIKLINYDGILPERIRG